MSAVGYLSELQHEPSSPVRYYLVVGDERFSLNERIGTKIVLTYLDEKACCHCGRISKKLYNNGYCYPCFIKLAECDLCIVKPHECHYHLGTCRDESFAESHCMIPHYVYLAVSSGIKVGLTRKNRELTRWVDQGAVRAIPLAETPTRKLAGEMEFLISQHIPDKTDWRKMLRGQIEDVDLIRVREQVKEILPEEYRSYLLEVDEIFEFTYPMTGEMEKVKSLTFDKIPQIEGILTGIKGQYLILDQGVINMKKHTGYKVKVDWCV
ncbi:hypothetical protein DNHGIG_37970 [Collibacillus ludicampi]|uniref:DUF2797 domain-containing protein n=1 Tax=Collibacillus ludicampi TaxID=2771369 RepID=A0AAV4LK99_9BACL|nr:DUF2797 domain-containing protein [Collibacillus ludicampi]GIM48248.1 hypothetical protein DNHGIG_37970 [Collibacillus ludicampi]